MPLGLGFFHPSGVFASLKATYIDQAVEFPDLSGNLQPDDDQLWIADVSLGYRFPKRRGIFRVTIKNLFDEEFKFQDTDLAGELRVPFIQPEQAIFSTITLAF
jgi:outer membrane receptor protein involved in Fe transport